MRIEEGTLSPPTHPSIHQCNIKIDFNKADYHFKIETSIFVHKNNNLEENQLDLMGVLLPFPSEVKKIVLKKAD